MDPAAKGETSETNQEQMVTGLEVTTACYKTGLGIPSQYKNQVHVCNHTISFLLRSEVSI